MQWVHDVFRRLEAELSGYYAVGTVGTIHHTDKTIIAVRDLIGCGTQSFPRPKSQSCAEGSLES